MADNRKSSMLTKIKDLNTATRSTDAQIYGIGRKPEDVVKMDLDSYIDDIQARIIDDDRRVINSYVTKAKVSSGAKNQEDLYEIINNQDMLNSVQKLIGTENAKFAQTLKDYEVIKRCIPQVHKVITAIKNNIISPDAMADGSIGVKYATNVSQADRDKIDKLIGKYELNEKLQDYVMEYLIASVKYVTVVPYASIPDLLESDNVNNESADAFVNSIIELVGDYQAKSLLQESSQFTDNLLESAITLEYYEDPNNISKSQKKEEKIDNEVLNKAINEALEGIEFIRGGANYYRNAIINEAVAIAKTTDTSDSDMKTIIRNYKAAVKASSKKKIIDFDQVAAEGMVDIKTIKKIREKVDFRGCHLEELLASKVIPFKLRDTLIGYFYVEDKYETSKTQNLSSVMDKINSSVYMKNDKTNNAARVEGLVIKAIGDKLIQAIDHRFINDNYDDLDIIYEFVKDNALHRDKKRVVFFHPDDVCEFRRKEGSIMKNCMFLAKLYILTLLSNVITNVTRGADRNIHYVKTGLTTDIEGHTNSAIRAIKQNQIRYSDMGTINEIFNLVGSTVDVFMPVSVDGERPIETETISGQNVDMNNDFLQWLIKSIIQSFGVPASVIDDFENIEFAKTIAMSNMDMAKATLDAQNEIVPDLTKMFRLIVSYEYPEFEALGDIELTLNPPSVIVFEMNRERINSITEMADTLSQLLIAPEGETLADKQIRLFKLEYFKANMPTLDWDAIDAMVKTAQAEAVGEKKKEEIQTGTDATGDVF